MSNGRLEQLERQTGFFFTEGSPLLLEASALYLDKTNDSRVLQLKWRNIDHREVKAVMIEILGADAFGSTLDPIHYQYDGLHIPYGSDFGGRTPILIKDQKISKYEILLKAVSFSDDSVWHNESLQTLCTLPKANKQTLNGELLEQYKRELSWKGLEEAAKYVPQKIFGLWQCGCGSWQPDDEDCLSCGATWSVLTEASDETLLSEHLSEYLAEQEHARIEAEKKEEEERQAAENAQREAEEKRKKTKRNLAIAFALVAVLVAAILVVTQIIIPGSNYQKAEKLRAAGNYSEAVQIFSDLGEYRDARNQIAITYYAEGEKRRDNGDWSGAVTAFTSAGNYSDAATQISATYYAEGQARLVAQEWNAAVTAFNNAGDYSDSATMIKETRYQEASSLEETGNQQQAKTIFIMLEDYKDSYDRAYKPYYDMGLTYRETQAWESAITAFEQAEDYKDAKEQISATRYLEGETKRKNGDWGGAIVAFEKAGEYSDSKKQITETHYQHAASLVEQGKYYEAIEIYNQISEYSDVIHILASNEKLRTIRLSEYSTVGNTVLFGHYEQDNDRKNGKEPIEWIVLDAHDGKALLFSKYILDEVRFSDGPGWEDSWVRNWMNNTFINEGFNASEQKAILMVTLDNSGGRLEGGASYGGGNDTNDRVFCLSYEEFKTYRSFMGGGIATAYAKSEGVYVNKSGISSWWLRTNGVGNKRVWAMSEIPGLVWDYSKSSFHTGARPALWVDLNSDFFVEK